MKRCLMWVDARPEAVKLCSLILALLVTDSGGMQKDATCLGIPMPVLRDRTERPEGVAAGVLRMAGTDPSHVACVLREVLDDPRKLRCMGR